MNVAALALLVGLPLFLAARGKPERMLALAARLAFWPFRFLGNVLFAQPARVKGTLWTLKFWALVLAIVLTLGLIVRYRSVMFALVVFWLPFALLWGTKRIAPKKGVRSLPRRRHRRR